MSRSLWKGPFVDGFLIKKINKNIINNKNKFFKIWTRRSTIIPQFIGLYFGIYNGKKFIKIFITEDMVGKKFGEFALTRTFKKHSGNKKNEK